MVLVYVSITLSVMLIYVAFVIDLGHARQLRRQAQNGADAAALAAAQDLTDFTMAASTRISNAVATAQGYVSRVYGTTSQSWSGCVDPAKLASPSATTQCISFDSASRPTKVRVQLPDDAIETFFGGVTGRDTLTVKGNATAAVGSPLRGRLLPLAVDGGGGLQCVENSGNDHGCNTRKKGNFGDLNSPRLNRFITSNDSDALRINFAIGLDHGLVQHPTGGTRVCDGDLTSPCITTNAGGTTANYLNTATGNSTNEPTDGLVTGFTAAGSTFCGRLQRIEFTEENLLQSTPTPPGNCTPTAESTNITVLGETINGRHIAYYLEDASKFYKTSGGGSVNPKTAPLTNPGYQGPGNQGDSALDCFLSGWTTTSTPSCPGVGGGVTAPIFDHSIIDDPRFGYIPIVANFPSGGSQAIQIVGFKAAFLYNLYASPTNIKATDAWVFDPALIEAGPFGVGDTFDFVGGAAVITLVG